MAVNPSGQGLKRFLETAPDEPVVMLNLLRFTDGGQDSYERYLAHFGDCAAEAVLRPTTMRPLPTPETTATA
ncbi:MAG: hypothetical protein GEU97_19295 [Actinophytocola sp.]|nr:hypothetical protein [Actinophytocola sp.]